jgi:hypothetical protein
MPRMLIVRLGNDHTSGAAAGKIAPLSMFADNDYALGMIVEAVSKSKFWPKTAIFVLEDDAQNGPDHVDSHRSVMLALSPYTRRGIVDSSMYNTTSVLHTMSLILGLKPMTHFDASSRPLVAAFAASPNSAPYVAEKPRISLTERNPAATPAAKAAEKMDLDEADEVDDDAYRSFFGSIGFRDVTLEGAFSTREKGVPTGTFGTKYNDPRTRTTDDRSFVNLKFAHEFPDIVEVMPGR